MAAERDRTALRAILDSTLRGIAELEEECMFITEIIVRKKFKTLAETRPAMTKDRKKRKVDGVAPPSAKKAKTTPTSAPISAPVIAPVSWTATVAPDGEVPAVKTE